VRGRADAKRSPEFASTYQAITRRRGKKIATTAVARKLLTRAYHLFAAEGTAGAKNSTVSSRGPADRTRPTTGRVTKPRASSQNRMSRPRAAR